MKFSFKPVKVKDHDLTHVMSDDDFNAYKASIAESNAWLRRFSIILHAIAVPILALLFSLSLLHGEGTVPVYVGLLLCILFVVIGFYVSLGFSIYFTRAYLINCIDDLGVGQMEQVIELKENGSDSVRSYINKFSNGELTRPFTQTDVHILNALSHEDSERITRENFNKAIRN